MEYPQHGDFKLVFWDVQDYLEQSEAFLSHISRFIKTAEEKLNTTEIYSMDCHEFYFAKSYGNVFRDSFLVTQCSYAEICIKKYIEKCYEISNQEVQQIKKESVFDYLKLVDKEYFGIGIDFNNVAVIDFKGLLALRNAIVHSGGTFQDVQKYKPQIMQLARKYNSIEILRDHYIIIDEKFCRHSLIIVRSFFFYLTKLAIRRFYSYVSEKEYWKFEEKNCR